jgi:Uma2 family endonuclease
MSTAKKLQIAEQEYLDGEQHSDIKHEFIDGNVYAMTGTSDDHNLIAGNVFAEFRQHLKAKPCKVFFADVMLKADTNIYYPDVMVICETNDADTSHVKHSPTVIVEVLSPSTRRTDITIKKIAYLNLPSLQEYILIEQDKCEIVVFRRSENWASTYYVIGDVVTLDSIDVSLSVEEIYERVVNNDITAFLAEKDEESKNV